MTTRSANNVSVYKCVIIKIALLFSFMWRRNREMTLNLR